MNKVFLSHSSADKGSYVDVVARILGEHRIEYDAITFEEGERSSDEIAKRIDESSIFALFISDQALSSGWVQSEIARARERLSDGGLRRFWPVIVDPAITYLDSRIPDWVRKEYNLKLVSRPAVAARRLLAKLRQLHWDSEPISAARRKIFVGRNDIIAAFERRMDDVDQIRPNCVVASGLPRIGRSRLLRHALVKANLVDDSFEPVRITLERVDSIEDLIVKLFDTGLTVQPREAVLDLLSKSMQDKVSILKAMLEDVRRAREVVLVQDLGCLVSHSRDVPDWFIEAITSLRPGARPVLCVASTYRTDPSFIRRNPAFFAMEVPELAPSERSGLLRRVLELSEFQINPDDFQFFSAQLKGYPEEAIFCAELIADSGISKAKNEAHLLTEFNTERASLLLRQFENDPGALDFVYLLSEFEFVGVSFLFEIAEEGTFQPLLERLVTLMICDYVGAEREYVRLNDTVRDLIRRNRFGLPEIFATKLRQHVRKFVEDTEKFERDAADFFYSMKSALAQGIEIDARYLAPSHIVRTMKDLYFSRNRDCDRRLLKLAEMLFAKESSLDAKVVEDARYYYCLCLARQKDRRVVAEAQKVSGPEHDFILGFYYRHCGRHAEAIERLSRLLDKPYIASRAKRELVQVYLFIEEYEKALAMARENYLANRGNQYPIQSYLMCLLNSDSYLKHEDQIRRLIEELGGIGSDQAKEMTLIAKGIFEAKFHNRKESAYDFFDAAYQVQESHYPLLSRFDVALRFRDLAEMRASLDKLTELFKSRNFSKNTLVKNEAYYLAASGRIEEAKAQLSGGLENYPQETIKKFMAKIENTFDSRAR